MTRNPDLLTSRNWFGKASAGLILGFGLAIALTSILQELAQGAGGFDGPHQMAMWLVAPIWCAVLSFCFFFTTGARAWLWLAAANAAAWAVYIAIRISVA